MKAVDGTASAGGAKGEKLLTINNSLEVGASTKVVPVEVEGSIHLDHVAGVARNLFQAALAYISDQAQHIMHPQITTTRSSKN